MSDRIYNKLYVNKNREEGSEKIFLGYQTNTTEFTLYKDQETYFNIPAYTTRVALVDTTLGIDGATGGSFPAVSDRIFESRKNYSRVSNNGSPSEFPDGTWFCSWLYRDPVSNALIWKDRYFNASSLASISVDPDTTNGKYYILNVPASFIPTTNSPIYDATSEMVLEPSVLYKYFHIGEKTAQNILTTFKGLSSQHLLFEITDWKSGNATTSSTIVYPITVMSSASSADLYPVIDTSQIVLSSTLGFEHNKNVEAYIDWNPSYIPSHEFTIGLWCKSNDWSMCPSTQLIGNYSANGGFGISVETNKTYPFFVIPEINYGHLIFINQEFTGYIDKPTPVNLRGGFVAIDSNNNSIYCSLSGNVYKTDHLGNVLATNNISFLSSEAFISLVCDGNDNVNITTSNAVYVLDNTLTFSLSTSQFNLNNASSAFTQGNDTQLITLSGALDLKYIEKDQYAILTDGNLYKNRTIFLSADGGFTNLQVDPNNMLWLLHGTNNVSVFDPNGIAFQQPSLSFTVGTDSVHSNKYFSFINIYNRDTLESNWVSVIFYGDSHYIYSNMLDGRVFNITDITPFINFKSARQLNQNPDNFAYGCNGDFTGYERKRIFNYGQPKNQLVINASLKDKTSSTFKCKQYKANVSIDDWNNKTWKHIILTHKNKSFTLYVNGIEQSSFSYSGKYELTYEHQPFMYIGSPLGVYKGLNNEVGSIVSLFNGVLGNVVFYDYSLTPIQFNMFLRANIAAEDIIWSLPIPSAQYIEKIERMFKNKLPGSKSNFYNIKLSGTSITDPSTRTIVEEQIKQIVAKIAPSYTDLVKIIWLG
jgi:hypothetical protein